MINYPAVPCPYCRVETYNTGTKLCDRCWELKTRIQRDPEIARKILKSIKTTKEKQQC